MKRMKRINVRIWKGIGTGRRILTLTMKNIKKRLKMTLEVFGTFS